MIRNIILSVFPVVLRLVGMIIAFRGIRFLIRQWKGLGKR